MQNWEDRSAMWLGAVRSGSGHRCHAIKVVGSAVQRDAEEGAVVSIITSLSLRVWRSRRKGEGVEAGFILSCGTASQPWKGMGPVFL